jgi:hypothetical protein
MPGALTSPAIAPRFELLDSSGRVISIWTTDQHGRPFLALSDAKWEGSIRIGPIEQGNLATGSPSERDAWGIDVTAPEHAANATLGTSLNLNTKKQSGFVNSR